MEIKRKRLKGLLKALVLLALVLIVIVFVKSLFPSDQKVKNEKQQELVHIDLRGIQPGEIRRARFNGKEVGVLKRRDTYFKERITDDKEHLLPDSSLDKNSRSLLADYFVYYNFGDSGNCPLFHNEKGFKDICSQKVFDETGREKGKELQGYVIKIPPHSFNISSDKVDTLLIGKW